MFNKEHIKYRQDNSHNSGEGEQFSICGCALLRVFWGNRTKSHDPHLTFWLNVEYEVIFHK